MGDYIESTWKDNRTTGYGIQRVWTNGQAIIKCNTSEVWIYLANTHYDTTTAPSLYVGWVGYTNTDPLTIQNCVPMSGQSPRPVLTAT
nr:MAG TPA: hypothetical protein [Bacteriophage sp.]